MYLKACILIVAEIFCDSCYFIVEALGSHVLWGMIIKEISK